LPGPEDAQKAAVGDDGTTLWPEKIKRQKKGDRWLRGWGPLEPKPGRKMI